MAQTKRIVVCMPDDLLASIDDLVLEGERNRSAFVREALRLLVRQRQRTQAGLQRLKRGYETMGRINLAFAEEGLREDLQTIAAYERVLGERENG